MNEIMKKLNKDGKRAKMFAESVKAMLTEDFDIINDTKVLNDNMIQVRVVETHADEVMEIIYYNFIERLTFVMMSNADEVTTLTYALY